MLSQDLNDKKEESKKVDIIEQKLELVKSESLEKPSEESEDSVKNTNG